MTEAPEHHVTELVRMKVADIDYWYAQPGRGESNMDMMRGYEAMLPTEEGRQTLGQMPDGLSIVRLWEDIQAKGMRNPLICIRHPDNGKTYTIIGNQRLAVLRVLGWKEVDVTFATGATAEDRSRHAIRLKEHCVDIKWDRNTDTWVG